MIAIADINTLWRKKPFQAMAALEPMIGLRPQSILSGWRGVAGVPPLSAGGHPPWQECRVLLPPGWASKWTGWTARKLQSKVMQLSREQKEKPSALVVTSPHYLDLVRRARKLMPVFYYCSDDYSQYHGWGGGEILRKEAELMSEVQHSFMVSHALARRAAEEYRIPEDRVSVSPNATEEAFLSLVSEVKKQALLAQYPAIKRPLVGVIGAINDRLDLDLIAQCADLPEVGSVVMVGRVEPGMESESLRSLQAHERCVFVGQRPHEELPVWMQALDVALIPYRDTPLNRACSPMRLFDHLAAGKPIVATSHCEQLRDFSVELRLGSTTEEVLGEVARCCTERENSARMAQRRQAGAAQLWSHRAAAMHAKMKAVASAS